MRRGLLEWVQANSHDLIDCARCDVDIEVYASIARAKSNIYLCRLSCSHATVECCVKEFTKSSASDIERLAERGYLLQPHIARQGVAVPVFRKHDADLRVIAMTFMHGEPLEGRIVGSFFRGGEARIDCCEIVRRLGGQLAGIHRVDAVATLAFARSCRNEEYVRRIAAPLSDPFVFGCLSSGKSTPKSIVEALPESFWTRHEKRFLHGDFQAKNVLVGDEQKLEMIDLSYGHGHPLFDVAQFLVQLVRLHRRWNFARAARLIREYGDVFLDSYFSGDRLYLREDLPFFLLWANAYSLQADRNHARPVRMYISCHLRRTGFTERWSS